MSFLDVFPQSHSFRNKSKYLLAVASELLQPAVRYAALAMCGRKSSPPPEWRKGVLIGADHIGDVLWITPSLPALAKGLPDCQWHCLASTPASQLLETNPHMAGCIPVSSRYSSLSGFRRVGQRIRRIQFDVALCYHSVEFWRELFLAAAAGIPNKVGYVHKGFSGFVTKAMSIAYPQPFPAYFRDLVGQLTNQQPDWPLRPQIFPTLQDESDAESYWRQTRRDSSLPVLACFPTTRQPGPVWPDRHWAECLRLITVSAPVQVVLCGSKQDIGQLSRIRSLAGCEAMVNAGDLGLRALACWLRKCALALTVDSGPRHMANAADIPVFFLRSLWQKRIESGPYVESEHDLSPEAECLTQPQEAAHWNALEPTSVAGRITAYLQSCRS